MTLKDFYRATAGMPGSTRLLVLDPWGSLAPAAIVTLEDLLPGDPLRDDLPPDALTLVGQADEETDPLQSIQA